MKVNPLVPVVHAQSHGTCPCKPQPVAYQPPANQSPIQYNFSMAITEINIEQQIQQDEDLPIGVSQEGLRQGISTHVGKLLSNLGVPKSTPVDIKLDQFGNLLIDADHPQACKIRKTLAEDPQLKQLAVVGRGLGIIDLIGSAHQQSQSIAHNDPSTAQLTEDWLLSYMRETRQMSYRMSYRHTEINLSLQSESEAATPAVETSCLRACA